MIKIKRIITIGALIFGTNALAKHLNHEKFYQDIDCSKRSGVTEYVLSDKTRVDCLTDKYAIEYDFANKWAESIGQALHYGSMTHKQAMAILIVEQKKDLKYVEIAKHTVASNRLDLLIEIIEIDHN